MTGRGVIPAHRPTSKPGAHRPTKVVKSSTAAGGLADLVDWRTWTWRTGGLVLGGLSAGSGGFWRTLD
eukprot:gene11569-biopygen203